jgi:hypothetical protein
MATYDLTASSTAGVSANSIAALPDARNSTYLVEKILDVGKLVSAGLFSAITSGDIFQVLEIPGGSIVIAAGAEVLTAFNGTTPTVDIDFGAGDDIVDGGDVTATGYLASGTNGAANTVGGSTYVDFVATTDTIDVLVTAGASDVSSGVLRVYAVVCDLTGVADLATEVARDNA